MRQNYLYIFFYYIFWAASSEQVSSGICKMCRFTSSWICTSLIHASNDCGQRTLIRLHRCTGWSRHFLSAYSRRNIFTWRCPFNTIFCIQFKNLTFSCFWLCWGLTTRQPLWVILCRLPEKGRKVIEEIVEEIKERDREERNRNESEETIEIKIFPIYPYLLQG